MTPFCPVRFVIQLTRDTLVPGMQGGVLNAMLCNANIGSDGKSCFPADFMLDTPEQARTTLRKGEPFAFGGMLLNIDRDSSQRTLTRLIEGLRRVGSSGSPRGKGLGGNFELIEARNLVSANDLLNTPRLDVIPLEHVNRETQQLDGMNRFTLRLLTPVRIERPGNQKDRTKNRKFYDESLLDVRQFLKRLMGRMGTLRILARDAEPEFDWNLVPQFPILNQLVWMDMSYGGLKGKTFGGVVGRVTIQVDDPTLKAALVWGQYTRIGKSSNFGFGKYRIEQLGDDPFRCSRAIPLLESAWSNPLRDQLAQQADLDAGVISLAIQSIRERSYQVQESQRMIIGNASKRRELQIPTRRDRVLQRLVLDCIAPALDQLFESSSFAWRKGLGRHNCAREITRAYQRGYQYFIRADFDRFFEQIDHALLFRRLESCLADEDTFRLFRSWIETAMKGQSRGVPTGAPLSPILGNLLLDQFDEQIASAGGKLVRYGDDLMILFRDLMQAQQLLDVAIEATADLELQLNQEIQVAAELSEPFDFLGFRFEKRDRWFREGYLEPKRLEELGWFDASASKPLQASRIILPGETGDAVSDLGVTAVVGPGATHLEIAGSHIRCHYADGRQSTSAPFTDLEWLVVLGSLGMSSQVVRKLTSAQTSILLADDRGFPEATISADFDFSQEIVYSQVDGSRNPTLCLVIAKELVSAKLNNFRALAVAQNANTELLDRLAQLAEKIPLANNLDVLRGLEGAGAAAWFGKFNSFCSNGFRFTQRVSPSADDPVNVLLNIAYMHLYRVTSLAIRSAGLIGSVSFYHQSTGRFEGLASDLMEPFRFLMDRVVIESMRQLSPRDFQQNTDGPYRLTFRPLAARSFQASIWTALQSGVQAVGDDEPISYLMQIQRQARRLRRFLANAANDSFGGFRLP